MKKIMLYAATMTLIAAIISLIAYYNQPDGQLTEKQMNITITHKYIVKEYNGKIGVFSKDSQKPQETLNIYTDELPIKDKKMLKSGIFADTDAQLNSIIEDYDG